MDRNFLLQRKEAMRRRYKRKVMAVCVLSILLVLLILGGIVGVIIKANMDSREPGGQNSNEGNSIGVDDGSITPADKTPRPSATGKPDTTPEPTSAWKPTATPDPMATPGPTMTPAPTPKKIAIDAGHGADDKGAVNGSYYEKNANLAIAFLLRDALEAMGYQTYMVRETDVYVENPERVIQAEENGADLYVSIHLNSTASENKENIRGTEVYYCDDREDGSRQLASHVLKEVVALTGSKSREIKNGDNLIVLNQSNIPACLVECGFISSDEECAKLFDPEYQELIAQGIANGIYKFMPPSGEAEEE